MFDILYGLKHKIVSVYPVDSELTAESGILVDATQDGILIKQDPDILLFYPMNSVNYVKYASEQAYQKSDEITVEDSKEIQIKTILEENKVDFDNDSFTLDSDESLTIENDDGTLMETDSDNNLILYSIDADALKAAKDIAKILGCKKVIRNATSE